MNIAAGWSKFSARSPRKLWWLYLLVLGPITGVLVTLCVASLKAGKPILAAGCVAALATFWIAAPTLLGLELSLLPAGVRR